MADAAPPGSNSHWVLVWVLAFFFAWCLLALAYAVVTAAV